MVLELGVDYDEAVLGHLTFVLQHHLSPAVLESARVEVVHEVLGGMAIRLSAAILADRLWSGSHEEHVAEPATWWQMWKRDHPPRPHRWAVARLLARPYARWWRRHPVRQSTRTLVVRLDQYATYPQARVAAPALGRPVYVDVVRSEWRTLP